MASDRLKHVMWRRRRNPAGGWTRVALSALLALTNPVWFPEPRPEARSFMTRVVDGERARTQSAGRVERLTVMTAVALIFGGLVYALWENLAGWYLFLGACVLCLKWCHAVWMAGYGREEKA